MATLTMVGVAFERKLELGGGFRGRVKDKRSNSITESPVLDTVEAARYWVRTEVAKGMDGQPWTPGYVYKPSWQMNVWTR